MNCIMLYTLDQHRLESQKYFEQMSRCINWSQKRNKILMMCARKLGKLKDTKRKSIYAVLIIERPSIVLTMPNWDVLRRMGIPAHCPQQKAIHRILSHNPNSTWQHRLQVSKDCIYSPHLPGLYPEYILRKMLIKVGNIISLSGYIVIVKSHHQLNDI